MRKILFLLGMLLWIGVGCHSVISGISNQQVVLDKNLGIVVTAPKDWQVAKLNALSRQGSGWQALAGGQAWGLGPLTAENEIQVRAEIILVPRVAIDDFEKNKEPATALRKKELASFVIYGATIGSSSPAATAVLDSVELQ